jgi:hypothetical protein
MSNSNTLLDPTVTAPLKLRLADAIADIETAAAEQTDDPQLVKQLVASMVASVGDRLVSSETDWQPQALSFNFEAELPAPDWIVVRSIERGTVVVLSGDTGAAKSIVASSLIPAVLNGDDWLGLRTEAERVSIIDEENPGRLVQARLRALGVDNAMRERFRYLSREGIALGDGGRSDAWLRMHLEDFQPDLLIIDTLMAACAVEDTNSNSEAVRIMKFLRGLAREHQCAILLLHHERKQNKDYPSSSGQAMMGARQWAGQADAHMTLTVDSELIEEEAEQNGHKRLHRTFRWRPAEKDRDGRANRLQRISVDSEKDADGRLLSMRVSNEGEIEEASTETEALAYAIGQFVQRADSSAPTGEVALAVGRKADDSTFKRALKLAEDREFVAKIKRGLYGPGEKTAGLGV